MIEINLLPEELRRQESTPWPRRMAIFAGAGILATLAFMVAVQRLKTLPEARDEKKKLTADLDAANARIAHEVTPLENALTVMQRRQDIVSQVQSGVHRWSPRLDGLQQVLTSAIDGVWITGFSYEERQNRNPSVAGPGQTERRLQIEFASSDFSDGHDLYTMSNEQKISELTRKLSRNKPFMRDVIGVSAASWQLTDDYLKPPWNVRAMAFPLLFVMGAPSPGEAR